MRVGILTAGGDSPGLNAAIRAIGKTAIGRYGMSVVGFRDGFRGLAEDRTEKLANRSLSGILTVGGTILGTSRDKPHRMAVDGRVVDRTADVVRTYEKPSSTRWSASAGVEPRRTPCALSRPACAWSRFPRRSTTTSR